MMRLSVLVLSFLALACTTAEAKTVTVPVDAKAGPWVVKSNNNMKYGIGDASPPVIVEGISDSAIGKVEVYATGTTSVTGHADIPPKGIESIEANDAKSHGKYYPSFYTPKLLYPAYAHALVVSFVNAEGVLVSRPVIVGTGIRLPVPEGAVALAFGYNDVSFKGNSGTLNVTITTPDE